MSNGGRSDGGPGPDVVTFGEAMASFVSTDDAHEYRAIVAGAESNVAIGLARVGCSAQWVSRLGDDPLGRMVMEAVAAAGVEVTATVDPRHPTGVMVKHPAGGSKVATYYRSQSAARGLSPIDRDRFGPAKWVHATGITPSLSDSARALVEAVLEDPAPSSAASFDVNYRSALWPDAETAASVIIPLARRADLVFIGDDEAMSLLATSNPVEIASEVSGTRTRTVVIKHGPRGATAISEGRAVFAPALPVLPVDATGAGDAFAAGFLAAACFGWSVSNRLRLGHDLASRVVRGVDDALGPISVTERASLSPDGLETKWASILGTGMASLDEGTDLH